jgi:UDP-N-acetylmuramoyl-tripeptide--D-alanyl-D-alanine ligase
MIRLSLAEIAAAVGGTPTGDAEITGAVTVDSRTVGAGDRRPARPRR